MNQKKYNAVTESESSQSESDALSLEEINTKYFNFSEEIREIIKTSFSLLNSANATEARVFDGLISSFFKQILQEDLVIKEVFTGKNPKIIIKKYILFIIIIIERLF